MTFGCCRSSLFSRAGAWLAFGAATLLDGSPAAAAEAHAALNGRWRGDMQLTIDTHRAQAHLDPELPFQWEAFNVKNVEGGMVVFTVGARLFIAYVSGDQMMLTGPGLPAAASLNRVGRLPVEAAELPGMREILER
jgi:hypothetical protein